MSYFSTINFNPQHLGAFGDLQAQKMTPVLQLSFASGLKDQLLNYSNTSTGNIYSSNSRLVLETGTSNTGSAIVMSDRTLAYRAGQGTTIRMTPIFESSANNSKQYFGVGNETDGYFIGYSNTTFGIFHRNRGIDTIIPQASWNGDTCNGNGPSGFNWNTSKGIPVMIKYPFLGYGNIFFYVQNPDSGGWILFHIIKYADTSTETQLSNPFLNIYGQVINQGNNTNLRILVGSIGAFIDGERFYLGPNFAIDSSKASVTTETNILSIKNCSSVNGITNRGMIRLRSISIASQGGNGIVTIRCRQDVTVGGTPNFIPISGSTTNNGNTLTNAQSIVSYDVSGTTITTSSKSFIKFNCNLNTGTNFQMDLTQYDLWIPAGETIILTAQSTASTTVAISLNWQEDVQ